MDSSERTIEQIGVDFLGRNRHRFGLGLDLIKKIPPELRNVPIKPGVNMGQILERLRRGIQELQSHAHASVDIALSEGKSLLNTDQKGVFFLQDLEKVIIQEASRMVRWGRPSYTFYA